MMFKNSPKTPWLVLFLLVLLWGLNYLAGVFDLYYMISWYDLFMHSLGGIILGLMGIILLRRVPLLQNLTSTQKIIWVILCGLLGGIAWEAFEYVQDVYLHTAMQISLRDTLTDIVADTLGAAMVGIVYWLKNKL
jgi:hypothetical protein